MLLGLLGIEGFREPRNRTVVWCGFGLAIVAVLLRAFFWWYTGCVFEDALITTIHSENCVSGIGLTHHASEPRVHGFTSPLSVLFPLLGNLISLGFGIPFIKLVSLVCSAGAVLYIMAIAIHPRIQFPAWIAFWPMAFVAVEHQQIYYGMSGMETQIVTMILLMSVYYAIALKPLFLGISLGLCMLARPDFAFWTAIVGIYVLLRAPRSFPLILGSAMAVYMPWVLFTTLYYGSPMPNTILAKGMGHTLWWKIPDRSVVSFFRQLAARAAFDILDLRGISPERPFLFSWGRILGAPYNGMALFLMPAVWDIVRRKQWEWIPVLGFISVYLTYYVFFVESVMKWYTPPLLALVMLVGSRGLWAITDPWPQARWIQRGVALLYLSVCLLVLPSRFVADREVQVYIENGVRKPLGEYLAHALQPTDTISCEPLGYIGYYSRKTIYDWPGLGSKKVTDFLRTHPNERTMNAMLVHFTPDCLVLRPWEYEGLRQEQGDWLARHYREDKIFEVSPEAPAWLHRRYDSKFYILRKIS